MIIGKKLLSNEVNHIVLRSFTIPEMDHLDYYSNIVEEHISNDFRIIEKLKYSISLLIDWHLSHAKSDESFVPLSEFGIQGSANMAYFERVLKIIEDIEKVEMQKTKAITDHSLLLEKLSKYITGINPIGFSNIIEHHSLPKDGTQKANWIGNKADARRFGTFIKITRPAFNKCFKLPDDKPLLNGIKDETFSPITVILTDYLKKIIS